MFEEWNQTELDSFLIEITRDIMKFKDSDGNYLLEKIRDTAGQVCNMFSFGWYFIQAHWFLWAAKLLSQ